MYRQGMIALQWMQSARAVMYDPEYAGFFLRDKAGVIHVETGPCGDGMVWNLTNASAVKYYQDVYIGGPRGTGSPLIDGIFLDDPGPGTLQHPMAEYQKYIQKVAAKIGMSADESQALSIATYKAITELRHQIAAQGKMVPSPQSRTVLLSHLSRAAVL